MSEKVEPGFPKQTDESEVELQRLAQYRAHKGRCNIFNLLHDFLQIDSDSRNYAGEWVMFNLTLTDFIVIPGGDKFPPIAQGFYN